ncbi:MAG TPA: DnaB-like helicase C-terminal domain-containing protein [Verrucomicrobiae bacterium]|nr:DnaB-like helicase C-terminal domain-containing protein [Verrucomicrobiae bacterium]
MTTPAAEKLPPNSPEAERGVLGCIMLDPTEALPATVEGIGESGLMFYDLRNRYIFGAMVRMEKEGTKIDTITLMQSLSNWGLLEQVGGMAYLAELPDAVPSAANLDYYLEIVREKYVLRQVLATCTEGAAKASAERMAPDALLAEQEQKLLDIRDGAESKAPFFSASQASQALIEDLERRGARTGLSGLRTGFGRLDFLTDGLQFGEQTIIAARPSQGKTAIGLNIVEQVCLRDNQPTLIASLEMSKEAIMRRLASAWCRIPMNTMRSGKFREEEQNSLAQFALAVNRAPLYVVEGVSGMNIGRLSAVIRRLARKARLRFVLIDYMQKIQPARSQEKRTYEVAEVSTQLKGLAVQTGAAFLTLAQLNREPDKDKGRTPRLADLADSSQIERDGDTICLLQRSRDENSQRLATLFVAKQRDGELGDFPLIFEGMYCRFQNASSQDSVPQQSPQDEEPS